MGMPPPLIANDTPADASTDDTSPIRFLSCAKLGTYRNKGTGRQGTDIRFRKYKELPHERMEIMSYMPEKQAFVYDQKNPQLIEIRHTLVKLAELAPAILKTRLRYGWKPVMYVRYLEPFKPPFSSVDFTFAALPPSQKNCWFFRQDTGDEFQYLLTNRSREHLQLRRWRATKKAYFCNFIFSNNIYTRNRFCKLLSRYKPIMCPGRQRNNMPQLPRYSGPGGGILAKLDFLAQCRFTIAFESTLQDYYLSEKIYHAFCTGSIPIYFGCPQVAKCYNTEAFVNCHDYRSFDAVVERVKEIDSNPALYRRYANAPPILPSSRLHRLNEETRHHAQTILDAVIARRNEKCSRTQAVLRQATMIANCLVDCLLHPFHISRFRMSMKRRKWVRQAFKS